MLLMSLIGNGIICSYHLEIKKKKKSEIKLVL